MKLSAARDCYYTFSGNASSVSRQVAFAGIAVVWVFNQPQSDSPIYLPHSLSSVLLFLCFTLALDLLQYTVSTAIWGLYSRHKEKQLSHRFHEDPDIEPPHFINWPALVMFWLKIASLFCAYALLAKFLVVRVV